MPIYEYRCQSCGHELEKLQRMSDAALTDCPECGKSTLKRLVSAAGFRLKGAGWYETDFKKSNQRNLVDSGAGSGGEKSSGNGASADAGKESSKSSTTESSKESKSSDAGSTKSAEKPSKSSAPAASS